MITEETPTSPMRDAITTNRTIEGEITIDRTIETGKITGGISIDQETGVKVDRSRNYSSNGP